MSNGDKEVTVIPHMYRTYYDVKADLDTLTGLKDGEIAFATDEGILYRQDGNGAANWVAISVAFATYYDTKANLDAMTGLADGAIGYATDEHNLYRQDGGGAANWVTMPPRVALSGLFANRPTAGDLANGSWYYAYDTLNAYEVVTGAWVLMYVPAIFPAVQATVGMFQANAGTGTMNNPGNLNENSPVDWASATVINQYVVFDFKKMVIVKRYRLYGESTGADDGELKIQYWDGNAWQDWETGIPSRNAESWTSFETPVAGEVRTDKVKLVAVSLGSSQIRLGEVEIIY